MERVRTGLKKKDLLAGGGRGWIKANP